VTPGVMRFQNPMSALVWLALFVPAHLFGGRLALVLPVAAILIGAPALLSRPSPWEARRASRLAMMFFLILSLLDVVSFAYSAAFNGVRSGFGDVFALSRYPIMGLFVVHLIRHYDEAVRKSLEAGLAVAVYYTLFLYTIGARDWFLFVPSQFVGYIAALSVIHFLFFSRAPLKRAHAAASIGVTVLSAPSVLSSSREALVYFWKSPVFGWGPALYEPMSSLGNQYVRWMVRGGGLSLSLILIGLMIVCFYVLRAAWNDRLHLVGGAIFLGFTAGMLLAGAFLEDFRLFVITSFLIAGMFGDVR